MLCLMVSTKDKGSTHLMASRNLYKEVSDRILTELKQGHTPWVKPWSATVSGGGVVCNAVTNRPYSGGNIVLLWIAMSSFGYSNPRFLTFKQAKELGGNVRKGETGHKVYFVSSFLVKDEGDSDDDAKRIGYLKEYTVFNVAQCENLPEKVLSLGEVKVRNKSERDPLADEFVRSLLADIRHGGDRAFYQPGSDFVQMPEFRDFKNADNYYGVLFHELGHWTGAEKRCNRVFGKRFGDNAYAAEELVAELTAAFLCAEFGFDGDLRHAGYIASWIKMLEKDDRAFFTAASQAQKAADHMRGLAIREDIREAA